MNSKIFKLDNIFNYCGTHGYAYSDWDVPSMFLECYHLWQKFDFALRNFNCVKEIKFIDNFEMNMVSIWYK